MSFYYLKKRVLCGLVLMPTFVLANINPLDLDALLLRATQTHPLVNAAKADEMARVCVLPNWVCYQLQQ